MSERNGHSSEYRKHHVWCNFARGPAEDCPMCYQLFAKYPMEGMTPDEMMAKWFPDAIKREGT